MHPSFSCQTSENSHQWPCVFALLYFLSAQSCFLFYGRYKIYATTVYKLIYELFPVHILNIQRVLALRENKMLAFLGIPCRRKIVRYLGICDQENERRQTSKPNQLPVVDSFMDFKIAPSKQSSGTEARNTSVKLYQQ